MADDLTAYIQFHTWSIDINSTSLVPIILEVDADEMTAVCLDDDWSICHTDMPDSPDRPFPVFKGSYWGLVFGVRRLNAGLVVGYAKSQNIDGIKLYCYCTQPPPGIR